MTDLLATLKNFGFPVFVAAFLLIRIEPTLKKIETTCARLLQYMQNHHQ